MRRNRKLAAALLGLGLAGQCADAPGRQEQAGAEVPAGQEAVVRGTHYALGRSAL